MAARPAQGTAVARRPGGGGSSRPLSVLCIDLGLGGAYYLIRPRLIFFKLFLNREIFDPTEKYKMDHKRRGIALIFNHERFFWHLTLPNRPGTSADRDNLRRR